MKTARTVLATLGIVTLLYGIFALVTVSFDPVFAGRSIFQMFRDTGFPMLVIGLGCLLSVIILLVAGSALGEQPRAARASDEEDDDLFLENETVPADTYESEWTPAIKQREREALSLENEEGTPDLFADDEEDEQEDEPQQLDGSMLFGSAPDPLRHCVFCGTAFPQSETVCPKCGKHA